MGVPRAVNGPAPTDGRTNQLEMIRRVLADARDRSRDPDMPAAILLEGDPGIGRSTALAALGRHAAAGGFTVAGVCCDPRERVLEHRAAEELLKPLARDEDLRAGSGGSGGSGPQVLDRIVDAACTRSAVLLLADDLQWCDASSLHWLARLARRIRQAGPGRLVLLAGMRDGEALSSPEEFADFAGHCRRIRLAGLGVSEVCRIAAATLGGDCDPVFGQAMHDLTAGNPRLVHALVGALAARGLSPDAATAADLARCAPKSVADDVQARLRGLGPDAVALAEAVAVLGRHAELPAAAQLASLPAGRAAMAADRLSDHLILRRRQPLAFRHGLVAAALARFLPAGRSNELHLRAAAYLHKTGADVRETAGHLLHTGPLGESWVWDSLGEAARAAFAEGRRQEAITYARRALREPATPGQRAQILAALDEAEGSADGRAAFDHLGPAARPAPRQSAQTAPAGSFAALPAAALAARVPVPSGDQTIGAATRLPRSHALGRHPGADPLAGRATQLIEQPVDVITAPSPSPSALSSPSLEIRCLGGLRLLRAGTILDSSAIRPRVRSLLQLLAVHACRPVHREFLLDALWPGLGIQAGIRNLQVAVSQLRAFLEPESLHGGRHQRLRRDGESYRLALLPADRCDIREFESAVQGWKDARGTGVQAAVEPLRVARAWYGGDLLPEIGPTEWVIGDRLRLRALASSALGALAEAELGLGNADAACDAARASLDIDEYQDASWHVLISAYRMAGSHAAAERVRREYEKILRGLEG